MSLSDKPIILKSNTCKLRTFSLSFMDFTEQLTADVLNIVYSSKIIDFVMVNCSIDKCEISSLWTPLHGCRNLDLSYSRISGDLVNCILADSINSVKMASCSFDKKDVSLVCSGLYKVYNITHLNLNYNNNVCYYASTIAGILRCNIKLKHIEMAGCNLDMNGIIIICKFFLSCTRLQNINLSHNEVTGDAVDAVVSVLHNHY